MSPSGIAAALSNASLQGTYFFTFEKIDTSVLGFFFTTGVGTLSFDGGGKATAQGFVNRSGNLQTLSSSGTYTVDAAGNVSASFPDLPLLVSGSVSYDLNSLVASSVASANTQNQQILLATRPPAPPYTTAMLNGKYFLTERTITAATFSPQFENSQGTITFDGAGNFNVALTSNQSGSTTTLNASGTYAVVPSDGRVLLNLPGRNSPVTLGVSADTSLAVGATLNLNSKDSHDLFVLTKADAAILRNAGLQGSYLTLVSAFTVNQGFSTSTGQMHVTESGTASYQMQRNRMGTLETLSGQGTVQVDASDNLRFTATPNFPGVFEGGLGRSGRSWVAAAVRDPSLYNLLVSIRTPSLPNAVANAASFLNSTALSPGALFTIFGLNLARRTIPEPSFVPCPGTGTPVCIPQEMQGASVKIGGIQAPLYSVSPFQINAQVPFELPPGPAQITVTLDGVESRPLDVSVTAAGPGIFTWSKDGKGAGIFLHADYSLVSQFSPARPGEVVLIYATGLGAVLPFATTGAAPPSDPLFNATSSVSVQMGGRDAAWSFAGLASGFVGLYQINVQVPPDAAPGLEVPVVVNAAGIPSNIVTIPIAP